MSNTLETKLRISAEAAQAISEVRKLVAEVKGIKVAAQANGQAVLINPAPIKEARAELGALSPVLRELGRLALGFFGIQLGGEALRGLVQLADNYNGLLARLKVTTQGQVEYNAALAAASQLANKYNADLINTGRLFDRLLSSIKPLGGGVREATVLTEALLASLRVSGATAEEAASAVLQFSQAIGKGVLNGDEFRAVYESAPKFIDAVALSLGKTGAELRKMGEEGKLTTNVLLEGAGKALPELQRQAATIPPTVGESFTVLKNELAKYVSEGAKAGGSARQLADSVKLLADTVGPLVQLLTSLATKLISLGLDAVTALIGKADKATTGLNASFGDLLKLINSPGGLLITLAKLADGWLSVFNAKSKATGKTAQDFASDRSAIQEQIKKLEALGKTGYNTARQINELKASLAKLDADQAKAGTKDAAAPAGATPVGPLATLDDPATLQRLANEYKTRLDIEKKFNDDREQLIKASEIRVANLRKGGKNTEADTQEKATRDRLIVIERDRKKALEAFDKDSTATRVAQSKKLYDKELELLADRIERAKKLNQDDYDDGIKGLFDYLQARSTLEKQANDADIKKLEEQLVSSRRVLAENQSRLSRAPNANDREQIQEAVNQQQQSVLQLESDIEKKKRDQVDADRERVRLAEQLINEIEIQNAEIDRQLKEATGKAQTPEEIRDRVERQYEAVAKVLRNRDGGADKVQQLVDIKAAEAQLADLELEYRRVYTTIQQVEQTASAQQQAGAITSSEAERQVLEARKAQLPVLDEILAKMDAVAKTGDQSQAVAQLRTQLAATRDVRTEFEKVAKSSATSELSTFLTDIETGAKSAGDALRDMVGGFAKSLLKLLNDKLAEKLIEQLGQLFDGAGGSSAGSSGGGYVQAIGSFIGSFFHEGGVVGASGQGFSRAVPAGAWSLAPRYHTGGIAGLKPNEIPAVLQAGEEVLTKDNPRHISNASRSVGGLNVTNNISVSGGQGSDADQAEAARDLGRTLEAAMDGWAAKNMRPGGLFNKG